MFRKTYISRLKTLLISVFLAWPAAVFAGGCEDETGMPIPAYDAQQCSVQGGTWYVCMFGDREEEFERDRNLCEMNGGVWTIANSIVEIFAPIPKVKSAFIEFNEKSFFVGDNGITGNELWYTDGTVEGTNLLKDITPNGSSKIENLNVLHGKLYFTLSANNSAQLWVSDGTASGTLLIKDGTRLSELVSFDGAVFFIIDGELWKTDGTVNGTALLANNGFNNILRHAISGELMFFASYTLAESEQLWVTDGTANGTRIINNINPNKSVYLSELTALNNKLIFKAKNSDGNYSLWVSGGTEASTIELSVVSMKYPIVFGDTVLFTGVNNTNDYELWATDGTIAGTKLVKDINSGAAADSDPNNFTLFNNKVYFSAKSTEGRELWVTDGTESGTQLVKDIAAGSNSSNPQYLNVINNKLYFYVTGDNGGLWVSDGTSDGTQQLIDINPNGADSISSITRFNNKLYFLTDDGTHGRELWVSDGTSAGTFMLKDITEDGSSDITNLSLVGTKIYFSVENKLWVSDSTTNGTKLVQFKTELMANGTAKLFENIILTQGDNDPISITLALSDNSKGRLSTTAINSTTLALAQSQLNDVVYTAINSNVDYTVYATVVVNDGKADSQTYSHQINVAASTAPIPEITIPSSLTTSTNKSADLTFSHTGDTVTATQKTAPSHGVVVINNKVITYTPQIGYSGNDTFTLTLSNNQGYSVDKTISVTVLANTAPTPPTISSSTIISVAGQSIIGALQSADDDNDELSFSIVSGNDNGYFSVDENNNLIINDANTNLTESSYELVISANDGVSETISTIVFYVTQPLTFNYQGFISKSGQAVTDELPMTFKLYDSADATEAVWSTNKTVKVTEGIYNVVIGLGEASYLNSLNMLDKKYYLGISIASNSEMTPRQLFAPSGFTKILADKVNVLERKAN